MEEELLMDPGWVADKGAGENHNLKGVFKKREQINKTEKRKGLIRCFLGKFF